MLILSNFHHETKLINSSDKKEKKTKRKKLIFIQSALILINFTFKIKDKVPVKISYKSRNNFYFESERNRLIKNLNLIRRLF